MQTLGEKLRSIRIFNKMTQSDVSRNICNRSMLSQIENGTCMPSLELLMKISKRLNTSISDLELSNSVQPDLDERLEQVLHLVQLGEYHEAQREAKSILRLRRELPVHLKFECTRVLALAAFHSGYPLEALELFRKCELIANSEGTKLELVQSLNGIGSILITQHRYTDGLTFLNKALGMCSLFKVDKRTEIRVMYNIAKAHRSNGYTEESNRIANTAVRICRITSIMDAYGHLQCLIGLNYLELKNYSSAYERFGKARNYYEICEDQIAFIGVTLNMIATSIASHRTEDAVRLISELKLKHRMENYPSLYEQLWQLESSIC